MSHPDYEQTAHDHAALLVLLKLTGEQNKQRNLGRILDRVARVNQTKVTDCVGLVRDISARYIRDYPVDNNDWGDYQTHRRLLGLVTIGKYENQTELNELCRVHESLKVKYSSTLFDSRCVLIGPSDSEPSSFPTPSNFKARALRYHDGEACVGMEAQISEFLSSLFWVLESKRLERSREKVEKVSLLLAPFEKKDIVGLDLESRTNRKRCVGRMTKHLGDLSLQAGLPIDALNYYTSAADILKAVNDWLWLGGACEGLCAASVVFMYPNCNRSYPLQRNSSLQEGRQRTSVASLTSLPASIVSSAQDEQDHSNVLSSDEISKRYREAIIHYSKYKNAGIIEMEASYKAARVAVDQGWTLQAASFLQNVVFIDLTLTELEKVQRFTSLADLYTRIGFHRKSSFCLRLAATRYVSAQNPQPDWSQCYQLMLQALSGHSISLDPAEFAKGGGRGWPVLQVQLLQELVVAARRSGLSALATRHATFLLQSLWGHLGGAERRDLALQLHSLAAQCEGAPVPLVLQSGTVIPPVNLTSLPHVRTFMPQNLPPQLRPQKIVEAQEDCGPFLFTPIHFGSLERRNKTSSSKLDYLWVEGDPCEVTLELFNPLSLELKVSNMMLLTCGCVFESLPSSLSLPPESGPHTVTLSGVPKETGELQLQGIKFRILGIPSSQRKRQLHLILEVHIYHQCFLRLVIFLLEFLAIKCKNHSILIKHRSVYILFNTEFAEVQIKFLKINTITTIEKIDFEINMTIEKEKNCFKYELTTCLLKYLGVAKGSEKVLPSIIYKIRTLLNSNGGSVTSSQSNQENIILCSDYATTSRNSKNVGFHQYKRRQVKTVLCIKWAGAERHPHNYCRQPSHRIIYSLEPTVVLTNWARISSETPGVCYLGLVMSRLTELGVDLGFTNNNKIRKEERFICCLPNPEIRCLPVSFTSLSRNGPSKWYVADCSRWRMAVIKSIILTSRMKLMTTTSKCLWKVCASDQATLNTLHFTCRNYSLLQREGQVRNSLETKLEMITKSSNFVSDLNHGYINHRLNTSVAVSWTSCYLVTKFQKGEVVVVSMSAIMFRSRQFYRDIMMSSLFPLTPSSIHLTPQ
ncbi:hypothetical protein PR048_018423 [Dryococelus australis]|uniref:Trafficking protein particle complex subunit 9 n=1 Tax=Dryococelus australis TaxID=614101 RepID=A0ABQ9HCB9_9NEOP|nr:hypothetical protein PR048_018423 [Dryococelus australis]